MIKEAQDVAKQYADLMYAHGAHEPDWEPLEKFMPKYKWCSGFMFMGYSGKVRMYKHGFTRRYLNLDPEGNAYIYIEETDNHVRIPKEIALDHVFAGLKEMGVRRSTPFDDKARKKRQRALAEAGWTTVGVDISESKEPYVVRGEEPQASSS